MKKFKTPILLLATFSILYFISIGIKFSDEKMSIDSWTNTLEGLVVKSPIELGELTLIRKENPGCRFSSNDGVPVVYIQGNGSCTIMVSSSDKNVRSLLVNSGNNVVFGFIGDKGSDGQPSSAPFKRQTRNDLSGSIDIMSGGGALTVTCKFNQQCKVTFG